LAFEPSIYLPNIYLSEIINLKAFMIRLLFFGVVLISFTPFTTAQNDTWTAPRITDSMTVNPAQNKKWRMGEGKYSAKPKDAWELGIHTGHFFTDGDVDPSIPAGYGVGLHIRKAIHYVFSIRADIMFAKDKGLDPQFTTQDVAAQDLRETTANGKHGGIYRNFKMNDFIFNVNGVVNIGNLLFHKERNKWNWYAFMGVGFDMNKTMLDVLNKNGQAYDFSSVRGDVNTHAGRISIKKQIRSILDGVYETEARKKVAIFRLNDHRNIHALFSAGMGVSRKISKRINLSLEHQLLTSDNDLLDGFVYRTVQDQSNNNDNSHYTSLRLGINLGNFNNRTEPLYWLNPLDGVLNDVADLKQRPVLDLTDTDGDGVIDMIDQEKNSSPGALVDTKGVSLDSDKDGVPNYLDKEPYSAPGFKVDGSGVAQVEKEKVLSEDDVVNMINQRIANIKTDWFLPMIHFDLDKYYIKPEFYGQLYHVATVMKGHPELKVVAVGHTDVRNKSDYNKVLAYKRADAAINYLVSKYGISRDRFVLQYGGEELPMVANLPDSHNIPKQAEMNQYINRRVEFKVAGATDQNMERPVGPDAGKDTPGSSRPGPKYSGNVNSGY
jgi:outer membrane protein OmpA-like peptidoglycan-associated protein